MTSFAGGIESILFGSYSNRWTCAVNSSAQKSKQSAIGAHYRGWMDRCSILIYLFNFVRKSCRHFCANVQQFLLWDFTRFCLEIYDRSINRWCSWGKCQQYFLFKFGKGVSFGEKGLNSVICVRSQCWQIPNGGWFHAKVSRKSSRGPISWFGAKGFD